MLSIGGVENKANRASEDVVGRVAILDVGHGNACVIETSDRIAIIDTGKEDDLLLYLEDREIYEIDHLILSHGDEDHIAAAYILLTDARFCVRNVYYNSEQFRDTKVYARVRSAAKDAEVRKGTNQGGLARGARVQVGDALLEVLHPSHSDVSAAKNTGHANSLSIIVRVSTRSAGGIVFLAGDGDGPSLAEVGEFARARGVSPQANFLVFPHHGSAVAAGKDVASYVNAWLELVRPVEVVFSTKRGTEEERWKHPDPRVVRAIASYAAKRIRVMCTQLSRECCSEVDGLRADHVRIDGNGIRRRVAGRFPCGGSAVIDLRTAELLEPNTMAHEAFKDTLGHPMCRP